MGKFRASKKGTAAKTKTVNLAGGEAFKESEKLELVSTLLTSFAGDSFYEKGSTVIDRVSGLISGMRDKKFAAQAAVFARNEFGMRSISHVAAAAIVNNVKGQEWTKRFISSVVRRPDDMAEILAFHKSHYGTPVPNSLKKGFRNVFESDKFNEYQYRKYLGAGSELPLWDIINLVHPDPKKNGLITKIVRNELDTADTWETKLSEAGNQEDVDEAKNQVWSDLLRERKLGMFALLRNLRNIILQSPDSIDLAIEQLQNREAIRKSLILPFRFLTASEQIANVDSPHTGKVLAAIGKALELSFDNIPEFSGSTLVVIDCSGSMGYPKHILPIATTFGAALVKKSNADVMLFSDDAHYLKKFNPADSLSTIANTILERVSGGGTNFHAIFQRANKPYTRIFILSDMQGWIGGWTPAEDLKNYKIKYDCNPFIYSFNLNDSGTIQFPENNVFALAGFSEKIFDIIDVLEQDKKALIHRIEQVEFT